MIRRRLLLDEPPLLLLPTLAETIGLNEAIILQQFNYWIQASKNVYEGFNWTYNSYTEWQKQFPFFSKETLGRTIRNLEKMGLLISTTSPNKKSFDRTKWYRIDFDQLDRIFDEVSISKHGHTDSNDHDTGMNNEGINLIPGNVSNDGVKMTSPIPEKTSSETSSEKKRAPKLSTRPIFAEIQKYLGFPEKTDKDPIPNYGKEAKAIDTMLKRGYSEAEIMDAWKNKVDARGREFVSMVWVNEDIGKKPAKPRQASFLPDESSLVAAAKERGLVDG